MFYRALAVTYHTSKIPPSDGLCPLSCPPVIFLSCGTVWTVREFRLVLCVYRFWLFSAACTEWRAETILHLCCLVPLKFVSSDWYQRLRISVWRYWLNGCCYPMHYCPFDIPFVVFLGPIPAIAMKLSISQMGSSALHYSMQEILWAFVAMVMQTWTTVFSQAPSQITFFAWDRVQISPTTASLVGLALVLE